MRHQCTRLALQVLSCLALAGSLHAEEVVAVDASPGAAAASDVVMAAPAPVSTRRGRRSASDAVALEVTLAPNAKVDPELEADCKFEEIVATDVAKRLRHYRLGGSKPTGTDARVLRVAVTDVSGESGGVWTGTKSIRVHASLVVDGQVERETDIYRYNTAGNPFRSTCHIFRQHTKRLGHDLASWIRDSSYKVDDRPMGDKDEADE